MLPRVKIIFENGAIGAQALLDDAVIGVVSSGVAVADHIVLGTPYLCTKLADVVNLGITSASDDPNALLYKFASEMYSIAPEGTKLYIMLIANTVTLEDMADKTKEHGKKLLEAANGQINNLFFIKSDPAEYTPTIVDGLDSDVYAALIKGQELAVHATDTLFAPVVMYFEGRHFSGLASALKDLHTVSYNRCGVLIGDSVSGSKGATLGLLAGTIGNIPVQRSIARVRSGAMPVAELYVKDKLVEDSQVDVISDKGFITFRTFVGKSGYFFSDDSLATASTDDYALIPRRRVIDKAYRVAYTTLLDEIGEEIPVTSEGKIPAAICKNIENSVERAIVNTLGLRGNIAIDVTDPRDTGCEIYLDPDQNILATSLLKLQLRVKPYGYSKYIDCYLGFKTATT